MQHAESLTAELQDWFWNAQPGKVKTNPPAAQPLDGKNSVLKQRI